jgi:hypothetical protein
MITLWNLTSIARLPAALINAASSLGNLLFLPMPPLGQVHPPLDNSLNFLLLPLLPADHLVKEPSLVPLQVHHSLAQAS